MSTLQALTMILRIFLLLSIAFHCACNNGPNGSPQKLQLKNARGKPFLEKDLDSLMAVQIDSLKIPAVSLAVINDGKIVYHRVFGYADVAAQKAADSSTLFEAASLSKPVFAYLAMKMVEEGKLDLDKPLFQYLPFPEIEKDQRHKKITARMALSHQSGFPNWRWYDEKPKGSTIKDGDMYMIAEPGVFGYSGEAYHYLAKVAAKLNGVTLTGLDSIFQAEVAQPLHMQHSYFSWHPYIGQHKATGYQNDKPFGKRWPNAPPDEDSTIFGSASTLHTEAVNYARFLIGVMNGTGLKQSTSDEMLKQQSSIDENLKSMWGPIRGWSLGFAVEPTENGIRYSHGGDNGGFQGGCLFYRKQQFGYVYFTNCDKSGGIYMALRNFFGEL